MKNCKNCNNCKQVYRRAILRAFTINYYYCTRSHSLVELTDNCMFWTKRVIDYDLSQERFNEVTRDIQAIKSMLQD